MRRGLWLFVACYGASGAAALIYEVAWTRLLTLELGHTVAASSTVLAAFMGGLALGAWLAGRYAPPADHRLQVYAALEIFVAILAIALPVVLGDFRHVLAWAYADGNAPARFAFVRVTLSLALLGVPAAAMGATFPIAAAWLAHVRTRTPRGVPPPASDAGLLYAVNTAGAALGAVGAGFWLLPTLGLRGTTWIGVGLNTAAAFGALWLSRGETIAIAAADSVGPTPRTSGTNTARMVQARRSAAPPRYVIACTVSALSGFSALVYEVAWARLLALVIGPTTYAFATMVAAFISGIALGSMAGARLARRASQPVWWLAGMLVGAAMSASAAAWFAASRLPVFLAYRVARSTGLDTVLAQEVLSVVLLLLPTSFALGATFVLALATASSGIDKIGRDTARVYVANTLGAVAGALAAGFVLVPRLGLQATIVGMSRIGIIAGFLVAATVLAGRAMNSWAARGRVAALATAGVVVILLVHVPGWDRDLLASGAYKYARSLRTDELIASLRAGTLEYYREGAAATVSVRRLGGSRALAIDGKVDASNVVDMLTQRMLGLLPVLLHPHPADLLVIGLGSGVTLGSAMASGDVRHADVVEISPEVVEASSFFLRENGGALHAPGVRLVIGDGRSHLLLGTGQYDVIVSEPSNPWMAGVAALFTREFFEAARARLKPDGLLCQWTHTYEISADDLQSIVGTFASVFPQSTMWLVGDGDLLLIGTTGADIESRLAGVPRRSTIGAIPAALVDLAIPVSAAPFVLLSQFAGGPSELAAYSKGAVLQSDDRLSLEFTAVRAMYARAPIDHAATIRAIGSGRLPPAVSSWLDGADAGQWTVRGRVGLKAEAYEMALESFRRAVALDSRSTDALRGASEAAAGAHRLADTQRWLEALVAANPANVPVRVELSHVLAAAGDTAKAIVVATDASRLEPDNPRPLEELASIFADLGDANRLSPLAERLLTRFPNREDARYYHAASLFLRGRAAEAADEARRLLASNPSYAKAQNLVGAACATIGRFDCARLAFEASIDLAPRDPSPYVNLGFFSLQRGNPTAAAGYFSEALALDQASAGAREGLAQTRTALVAQ